MRAAARRGDGSGKGAFGVSGTARLGDGFKLRAIGLGERRRFECAGEFALAVAALLRDGSSGLRVSLLQAAARSFAARCARHNKRAPISGVPICAAHRSSSWFAQGPGHGNISNRSKYIEPHTSLNIVQCLCLRRDLERSPYNYPSKPLPLRLAY